MIGDITEFFSTVLHGIIISTQSVYGFTTLLEKSVHILSYSGVTPNTNTFYTVQSRSVFLLLSWLQGNEIKDDRRKWS